MFWAPSLGSCSPCIGIERVDNNLPRQASFRIDPSGIWWLLNTSILPSDMLASSDIATVVNRVILVFAVWILTLVLHLCELLSLREMAPRSAPSIEEHVFRDRFTPIRSEKRLPGDDYTAEPCVLVLARLSCSLTYIQSACWVNQGGDRKIFHVFI